MQKTILLSILTLFFSTQFLVAQEMNPTKLEQLITKVADTVEVNGNSVRFVYKEAFLICVYDENANRMRIISPIVERKKWMKNNCSTP